MRCEDESKLRQTLSRLLEDDALEDCLVDVPRRLISFRYVHGAPGEHEHGLDLESRRPESGRRRRKSDFPAVAGKEETLR